MSRKPFETVEILQAALRDGGYIANDGLSSVCFWRWQNRVRYF